MSADFDPYQEWLSIPPNERPANYYRLLGLPLFESNANVISNAADRQMSFVRTFQTGQYAQQSQLILNELAQARVTLLDKQKKTEYDAKLRAEQKSGSNGGIGVVSSLGSYGEVQSAPPPSVASLTPQPWSNDPQRANPGVQSHATPPGGNTTPSVGSSAPPPIPNLPNRSEVAFAFLKKHWVALLSAFFALQLLICGTGLLAHLLKSNKTEIVQNAPVEPSQKADDGTEDATPSSEVELAKRYYEQSVELQENENYEEALKKINIAVELHPDNEQYKVQQKTLARFVKTLGKSKAPVTPVTPVTTEDKPNSGGKAVPVPDDNDKPVSTQPTSKPQAGNGNRPTRTSMTPEEAESRLKAGAKAKLEAEEKAKSEEIKAKAAAIHNEAVELQKEGKYILAADKLNEAIELDPDNEQYKEEKSQFEELASAEESYNESVELEQNGQYAEALIKIEDALAIDPNNEDYIKEKLNIQTGYYKQYVRHRIQREYPQALQKIDKAIELVPKEEFYKEEKQKTEELVKAVEEGKELPEKDPDYGEPEEVAEVTVEERRLNGFEPGKEAGEQKTVVVDGIEIAFRWCPPGTFIMGSPMSEANRNDDENQHEVELTKGFWIMETQITVGMFKAFVNDTGYKSKGLMPCGLSNGKWKQDAGFSWLNPGFAQDDNCPVTCISWRDAAAFSKWLGGKIESKAKLPTEAQWEYACRAGSESAYFWGDALNGDKANCNGNYPYGTMAKGPYLEKTVPVRSYQSNAWGVCDMHGNVWEWCLDGYAAYPNDKVTDPLERGDGSNRVFRGGSWSYKAERCRSSFRANFVPAIRLPNIGGRCVVEPSDDEPKEQSDFGPDKNAGKRVVKTVNGVEFAFRWAPAGTFKMGSPSYEEGRDNDEKQHEVTLTKGFWMMETEVTQEHWKAVMETNPSDFKDDDLPVEMVSWDDCEKFCKKCTQLGLPVQLPTEAQWEYACRAGTTEPYAGNVDDMSWNSLDSKPRPVGRKYCNAWGLYDMHGNVWEWCQDWKAAYPSGNVTDPTGPSLGSRRVIRGGSWHGKVRFCRSASRGEREPDYRCNFLGFRCVSSVNLDDNVNVDENTGKRDVKVVNGVEFAFRWCPAGTFTIGSPRGESDRDWDERQHQVTFTKGFWMMETEVTQKQWEAVMETNPSGFKGDDLPVENVSWDDCQEFCRKCTKLGLPVQLPTEAQWEYACRAGSMKAYAGDLDEMAWYHSNSDSNTHSVGTKTSNEWGLYDMHGNVMEWCQDWFDDYSVRSVTDPTGPSSGCTRVYRGGNWNSRAGYCRSAMRVGDAPVRRDNKLGFRCVSLSLETSETGNVNNPDENNDKESDAPVNANVNKNAGKRAVQVVNGVKFAFRWCPAGTFVMGSPKDEEGHDSFEKQYQVTLAKGFWMMETEVTRGMFKAFVKETGYESKGFTPCGWIGDKVEYDSKYSWLNPGFSQNDNHPVTNISWDDSVEFCRWLSKKTGQNVTLPNEQQWEYACRAGTAGPFAGNLDEMAWYGSNSGDKTHPVGTKKPNAWGLYDMHGNVCERCIGLYVFGGYSGGGVSINGYSRGGSCLSDAKFCRAASNRIDASGDRSYGLGFRCVINIDSESSKTEDVKSTVENNDEESSASVNNSSDKNSGNRTVKVINDVEFAFRWCEPGTFKMRDHQVTLTKGFWMMETEVTQKQWKAIMRNNPSEFKGDDLPVEHVSWNDCQEFCKKCARLGLPVKLPTDAQWEYACRAGTTGAYAGNLDDMGWYSSNCGNRTHPVGTKKPNAWGFYDMHGNVREWCQDLLDLKDDYPDGDVTDPTGPSSGHYRVLRGGCWTSVAGSCRSDVRSFYLPDQSEEDNLFHCVHGFRCVIEQ